MDVQQKLDEITATVENARSMPMSASIVVNKAELIAMLTELRDALPSELAQAQQTVEQGDQVVEQARRQADQIIQEAQGERARLISGTEIAMHAQAEADRILGEAKGESEEERREADDYVDSKLANFEVVLTKTLGAIGRGRAKLRAGGAPVEGEDGEEFAQDAYRSPSPEVDEYVDVKLAALETALSKTLDAVGRGRDKLLGKRPIDELGAYLAAADEATGVKQGSERQAAVAAELAQAGLLAPEEQAQQSFAQGNQQHGGQGEQQHYPQGDQQHYPQGDGQGYPQQPEYWQPVELDPNGYPYQQPQQGVYQDAYQQGGQQQGYDPYGYQQQPPQQSYDPYGYQQQQPQQSYDAYGQPIPIPHQQSPHQQAPQQHHQGLDETSFFDTGFIDVSKLRELGGGGHQ
ncbi:ATP synthase F0 subunit B [Streptacidiphilus sp. EB129]|uniref:ATP synthase F0 subunit B n=1 Tax=Streptacidiphilus sp. EB129 TaxID=3156262 RepID=UPI0035128430